MAADYDIPMCPGDDPGADWRETGWDTYENAVFAHLEWCPNHPGHPHHQRVKESLMRIFLENLAPGEPVPLTLTPKGHAALARAL